MVFPFSDLRKAVQKMKVKKCFSVLLIMALLLGVVPFSALASEIAPINNQDEPYYFKFTSPWQDDPHEYKKENTSGVYIKSEVFPGSYNIYTNGYINGQWKDCTQRPAVVPGVGEYLIYNTIMEDYRAAGGTGFTYARLGAYRFDFTGGVASGVWSPDSVGNYPYINP